MEIQIQKGSSCCMACNTPFEHDQKHYSLLRIEGNMFLRQDYCERCWSQKAVSETDEVYSCWQTRYRDPSVEEATPKAQFMPLLNLCYESIAEGGPEAEAMAYMCALILRRQKVFKFVREQREESGRSVLVFADKHNDTQIKVVDPQLTDSQLEDVRRRLEELIGCSRGQADE